VSWNAGLTYLSLHDRCCCCVDAEGSRDSTRPVHADVAGFGRVNGYQQRVQQANNKRVDTYLGIPFARPPTGELRFRPPQPLAPPGDGGVEYSATAMPASCYQTIDDAFDHEYVDMWNPNTNMSEDCLYLNVWQPETADDSAVMVRSIVFLGGEIARRV